MSKRRNQLNIDNIVASLLEVQRNFDSINAQLSVRRENLTDQMVQNMVTAYHYLDDLVADKVNLLPGGHDHMLELNHIVLCGRDPLVRMEFASHIQATEKRFYKQLKVIKRWYKSYKDESTYKVAAQIYVAVLSQPQLFIEGNHRTGSLIASYFLLMGGKYPFVLNKENALAYFEPSSQIKLSNKETIKGKFRLPKYRSEFRRFLKDQVKATKQDYILLR